MKDSILSFTPEISVVMSVYNGIPYLDTAIKSILAQTFDNFEFIIIDDVSTDGSVELIKNYANIDKRIITVFNTQNQGHLSLGYNLAKGIELAKGKYIARMDQDDIAFDTRFEIQKKFFDENNDIDILGTWSIDIDEEGNTLRQRNYPIQHKDIVKIIWTDPIIHPSVMFKRESILKIGNYSSNSGMRDDYELWFRAVKNGLKFSNIPQALMYYRFASDYNKKKNFKLTFKQAIIGIKGCWSIKASPIAYIGVIIPLFRSILPGKVQDKFHDYMHKIDPRQSA